MFDYVLQMLETWHISGSSYKLSGEVEFNIREDERLLDECDE